MLTYKQRLIALCCVLGAVSIGGGISGASTGEPAQMPNNASVQSATSAEAQQAAQKLKVEYLRKRVKVHRRATWRWQDLTLRGRTSSGFQEQWSRTIPYLRNLKNLWQDRRYAARHNAKRPPHKAAWLCIHRYERHPRQGWRTNTGNSYYGGLQMDMNFQRTYGRKLLKRKGTANNWTPLEQIWVAEKAYRSGRGFRPWPNTARMCGLL